MGSKPVDGYESSFAETSASATSASAASISAASTARKQPNQEEEFDDFFEETVDEEDDEVGVTGVRSRRRIVPSKRTGILATFVLITLVSIAASAYTFIVYLDEYDYPPTDNSRSSLEYALYSLFALIVVTPAGFVILKFRITNLLIGVLGIKYAQFSYIEDQDNTIHQFSQNPNFEHRLHNFWAAYQSKHKCCGTKDIDRVEDWPYFLNSTDLPASCCTAKQQEYARSLGLNPSKLNAFQSSLKLSIANKPEMDSTINYCGRGLGRTRTRGLGYNQSALFKRMYSGFYISLTDEQVEKMFFHLTVPGFQFKPNDTLVDILDVVKEKIVDVGAIEAFMKIWKTFYVDHVCNTFLELVAFNSSYGDDGRLSTNKKYCTNQSRDFSNDLAYPADLNLTTPIESIGVIKNINDVKKDCVNDAWNLVDQSKYKDSEEYCKMKVPRTKENATTLGRELLLQLDYLTSYIYELGKPKVANQHRVAKNTWMLWPIPTRFDSDERYPYKLNANFLRVPHHTGPHDEKLKRMFYFSNGILENFLLGDLIHERPCEFLKSENLPKIRSKIARDLNRRWRQQKPFTEWKNREEGLGSFFVAEIHSIIFVTFCVSSICIFCVIILAIIFWQYYSRIKKEEYANLALPKEFEVLHLRRGSLLDEYDYNTDVRKKSIIRRKKVAPAPVPASIPSVQPSPAHLSLRQNKIDTKIGPGQHTPHSGHHQSHHTSQAPGLGHGQPPPPGWGRGQPPPPGGRGQPPPPGGRGQPPPPGGHGQPPPPGWGRGQPPPPRP